MSELTLTLDEGRARYAPGDEIRGVVVIHADPPRRCDIVTVDLWWCVCGEQTSTNHVVSAVEQRFREHGELAGEVRLPFVLRVPTDVPTTYRGAASGAWVIAGVGARIRWPGDERATSYGVDIDLVPAVAPAATGKALGTLRSRAELAAFAAHLGPLAAALRGRRAAAARERLRDTASWLWWGFWILVIGVGCVGVLAALVFAVFVSESVWAWLGGGAFLSLLGVFLFHMGKDLWPAIRYRLDPRRLRLKVVDGPRAAGVDEPLAFEVAFRRAPARAPGPLRWALRATRAAASVTWRKSAKGGTTKVTTWKRDSVDFASGTAELPAAARGVVRVASALPDTSPASLTFRHRRLAWELHVEADDAGHTAVARRPFVVLPLRPPSADAVAATTPAVAAPVAALSAPAGPGDVRRAAFALARLRTTRRMHAIAAFDPLWLTLFAALPTLPLALGMVLLDPKVAPFWVMLPLTALASVGVFDLVVVLPFAATVVWRALVALVLGPFRLVRRVAERHAERILARDGRLPRAFYEGRFVRERAVRHLLALEPDLVRDEAGVRALGVALPDDCPTCGGLLEQPGPGLRRCGHCEFERYDPLPSRPEALAQAEAAFGPAATRSGTPARDARARFRALLEVRAPWFRPVVSWSLRGEAVVLLGSLLLSALGFPENTEPEAVTTVVAMIVILSGFSSGIALAVAVYHWLKVRFVELRPGLRAYEALLTTELLAAVAHQGEVPRTTLARHLGVSAGHLDALLASLTRTRRAPFFEDRVNDTLVSAFARGDSRCPACGGHREPAEGRTLRCTHCGAVTPAD